MDDLRKDLGISMISISSIGDLRINFNNGYTFESFVNDAEEYTWYFKDSKLEKFFEVKTGELVER